MGFKPPRKAYKLQFEDEEYAGLEIVARSLSVADFLKISSLADDVKGKTEAEAASSVNDLFASFARSVVRWNIEDDDDKPVPVSLDGVKTLEFDFVISVIQAWLSAMTDVEPGLGKDSNSGNPALEQSLPMA